MTQSCATCKHAEFLRTPTGRIRHSYAGKCNYEIVIPVLPECVRDLGRRVNPFPKQAIWARRDGTDCPVWAPKS